MRKCVFTTDNLIHCKCILIDAEGGEMELKIRNVSASSSFGGPVELHMDCDYYLGDVKRPDKRKELTVRKVIYNPPATVVLWEDGTRTVVKCDELDDYNPDYGFALCYMKKALGNTSRALNDALRKERVKV